MKILWEFASEAPDAIWQKRLLMLNGPPKILYDDMLAQAPDDPDASMQYAVCSMSHATVTFCDYDDE